MKLNDHQINTIKSSKYQTRACKHAADKGQDCATLAWAVKESVTDLTTAAKAWKMGDDCIAKAVREALALIESFTAKYNAAQMSAADYITGCYYQAGIIACLSGN